jgi:hypothetical protein
MKMFDALTMKWDASKDGDLGPDYSVLLHLWRYKSWPDNDHLQSSQAWTVYKKRSGSDEPEVDPALYLRKTDWNFAYAVLSEDPTEANIEEATTVQETTLDIDKFQPQLAVASHFDIPVVLSDYWVTLAFTREYGLSIPSGGGSRPGVSLVWTQDGPDAWRSLISWTLEMIDMLDEHWKDS